MKASAMFLQDMSKDSKDTLANMLVYCLSRGVCMGMDEGVNPDTCEMNDDRADIETLLSLLNSETV